MYARYDCFHFSLCVTIYPMFDMETRFHLYNTRDKTRENNSIQISEKANPVGKTP
jgi:hypothetical protein